MAENFPRRPGERESPWYEAREAWDQAVETRIKDLEIKVDEGPTDWGAVLRSDVIKRLIVSKDAEHPTEPGDLLLLEDTESSLEEFTGTGVGATTGLTFVNGWGTTSYEVVSANDSPSRRKLQVDHNPGVTYIRYVPYTYLRQRRSDPIKDIEVAYGWANDTSIARMPRGVFFLYGADETDGTCTEVYAGTADSRRVSYRINGEVETTVIPVKDGFIFQPNQYYVTRTRIKGSNIYQKVWPYGEPEPEEWDFILDDNQRTNANHGNLGLRFYRANTSTESTSTLDFFSFALDGGRAPTPGYIL